VDVTEQELKKLRGCYFSLVGQQRVFDSTAASQWATKEAPVRLLVEEIERIEADFPGLLPPFRPKDFYSHPAYFTGGAYYDVSGIRSYLAAALGKVKAGLDAIDAAPGSPQSLESLPAKSVLLSETERILKSGVTVSVVFIDLDDFKMVNDTQGHATGDECLEAVVKIITEAVLHKGNLYRCGGDEFVVVLPNFEVSEATATAERIREVIGSANLVSGARVTASLGVASSSHSGGWTAASLVDAADHAMYRSKGAGRNRVTVHEAAVGDERVSKAKATLRVPANELARRAEAVELSISLRQAVSGNYMALVRNESDEEVSVGKISLERNGIELSQPGKPREGEEWVIAARSGKEITWAPTPDPVATLGMARPYPTSPVDIEMVVYYQVLEKRKVAKRKILVAVDYRNHRMDQFSP
jgi:diguanylate cyclase (GGDEF)-like protein